MTIRSPGTAFALPRPVFDVAQEGSGQPAAGVDGGKSESNGAFVFDAGKAYEGLEADNLAWLQKANLHGDVKALARQAYNQEKLIGSSIRIPKDDAPAEEVNAFLDKLGRPKTADEYKFDAPKNMPKELPYDSALEAGFRKRAHELGLSSKQAAGLRDLFVDYQVSAYETAAQQRTADLEGRAGKATAELEKLWGPISGDTAKANFEIADKLFTETEGGAEFLAELQTLGVVGPNKEILSAPLARMLAKLGATLYREDDVRRGHPDDVGNPFADGDGFNLTKAMQVAKADPSKARQLIVAAGKKPADFGLANY